VIHRVLVLTALGCSMLVLASFALFANDQVAGASKHQQNELVAGASLSSPKPHPVGQPRRFVDGAAHTLTSPFQSIVQSDSQWVVHGISTLFALLAYGFGLGYLARFSRGLS